MHHRPFEGRHLVFSINQYVSTWLLVYYVSINQMQIYAVNGNKVKLEDK